MFASGIEINRTFTMHAAPSNYDGGEPDQGASVGRIT
jgi:hypothetical protein